MVTLISFRNGWHFWNDSGVGELKPYMMQKRSEIISSSTWKHKSAAFFTPYNIFWNVTRVISDISFKID